MPIELGEDTGAAADMTDEQLDAILADAGVGELDANADDLYGGYLKQWASEITGKHVDDIRESLLREDFDESKVKRDHGKFASKPGGGASKPEEPAAEPAAKAPEPSAHAARPSEGAASTFERSLMDIGAGVEHKEHVLLNLAKDKVWLAIAALPAPIGKAVCNTLAAATSGGEPSAIGKLAGKAAGVALKAFKATFATYTLGQEMVERVAKARGLSDEQARRLRGAVTSIDVATYKPAFLVAEHALSAATAGAASFIPIGSATYLAYSTATSPLATLRAAASLVKDAVKKVGGVAVAGAKKALGESRDDSTAADMLADAFAAHDWSDWYIALYSAALDETGDMAKAIQVANYGASIAPEEPEASVQESKAPARIGLVLLSEGGYTGEKLDKLRRRMCFHEGKRVKCPQGPMPKPRPEDIHTVDSMHKHILDSAKGGLTTEKLTALAQHLQHLKVSELHDLKKRLGLKASGLKADLAKKIAERAADKLKETDHGGQAGRVDAGGSGSVGSENARDGGGVAKAAERPSDQEPDRGGQPDHQPVGTEASRHVPASAEEVNRRLDRFEKLFADRGQHEQAQWLRMLREHVNAVGTDEVLKSLGEEGGADKGKRVQYEPTFDDMGDFCERYLDRFGVMSIHRNPSGVGPEPIISSVTNDQGALDRGKRRDFTPADPTLKDKLEEAKSLPGLESSEDINVIMGEPVTHLTPDVAAKMDEKYGAGKWIIKAYGEDAAAGYGIFFPQRVAQITQDAKNTIASATEEIGKYGFKPWRNKDGKIIGIEHENGDTYRFGKVTRSEVEDAEGKKRLEFQHKGRKKYEETINGDVRAWSDRLAEAAENESGAILPGKGKDFMAQPAFPVVGVSEEERAAGVTIKKGQEGRVHIVTRNGNAEIVRHATWMKKENLPVVFETDDTLAMAQAAVDAINALPKSERQGQIYAPDVVKTADGFKVVEANPANETGSSGYLSDNPFIIDAYVSHMTGREPAHVRFIRKLLTSIDHGKPEQDAAGATGGSGGEGGGGGAQGVASADAAAAPAIDPTQPESGKAPEAIAAALRKSGIGDLAFEPRDESRRWDHHQRERHNRQVLQAARKAGVFVSPERFDRVTKSPNVGGQEHDVHEDPEHNRFFKFTKGGHFGQNKDIHEYLDRHRIANKLWPSLGYTVHGITRSPFTGEAQAVVSMNRIEGTHPEAAEVDHWFRSHGWEPVGFDAPAGSYDPNEGPDSWRDPKTGTIISDTHEKNFIKTKDGLVPIDVDIRPGNKGKR